VDYELERSELHSLREVLLAHQSQWVGFKFRAVPLQGVDGKWVVGHLGVYTNHYVGMVTSLQVVTASVPSSYEDLEEELTSCPIVEEGNTASDGSVD